MTLTTVESSSMYAIGYDSTTRTLDLMFYQTDIHRFTDVPPKMNRELMKPDSLGSDYALFLEGQQQKQELG